MFLLNPYRYGLSGPADPYFANVVSLLHFDGTNGSTSIVDVKGKTWTSAGPALSTAQSKFGGSSILLGGAPVNSATSSDFALAGDFCIEAWLNRSNTNPTYQALFVANVTGGASFNLKAGKLSFGANSVADDIVSPNLLANSTWVHVAAARSGSTLALYENGTQVATVTQTRSYAQGAVSIGATSSSGTPYSGYMDDFRLTNGVARYTTSFTVPTAAFPDH